MSRAFWTYGGALLTCSRERRVWRDPAKRQPAAHVIHNFGRADALDREALRRLARSISRVANGGLEVPEEAAPPGEAIALEWARPLGGVHVARALWEELGIGEVLRRHQRPRGRRAPHELALFTMVANRLLEPVSKLACHEHWVPEALRGTDRGVDFAMIHLRTRMEGAVHRTVTGSPIRGGSPRPRLITLAVMGATRYDAPG